MTKPSWDFPSARKPQSVATGGQQLLARAPSVASVITAEEIRDLGAKDLDEVLVKVPGLHVSKSEYMSSSQYLIRGMTSTYNPQVLMLMNGVPMTSLFLGNRTDFGTSLPVENISRIEVIRGPGSALYGADAFSGVINIITKNAKEIDGLATASERVPSIPAMPPVRRKTWRD